MVGDRTNFWAIAVLRQSLMRFANSGLASHPVHPVHPQPPSSLRLLGEFQQANALDVQPLLAPSSERIAPLRGKPESTTGRSGLNRTYGFGQSHTVVQAPLRHFSRTEANAHREVDGGFRPRRPRPGRGRDRKTGQTRGGSEELRGRDRPVTRYPDMWRLCRCIWRWSGSELQPPRP